MTFINQESQLHDIDALVRSAEDIVHNWSSSGGPDESCHDGTGNDIMVGTGAEEPEDTPPSYERANSAKGVQRRRERTHATSMYVM